MCIILFPVTNAYPRNIDTRTFNKIMSEIATAQDTMVQALYQGNIDQVGRQAWATLVDLVQETVSYHVAKWRDEVSDHDIESFKSTQIELRRQLEEATEEAKPGIQEQLTNVLATLNTTVNKFSFPGLVSKAVPQYPYTKTFNNSWDICYGYMSSCLTPRKLSSWYTSAAKPINPRQGEGNERKRRRAKEGLRTLSDVFEERCFQTCSIIGIDSCSQPNAKRTPDITVAILPDEKRKYLKIPVFTMEVLGTKDIWGQNEDKFPGFLAATQCLAFGPRTYYGEVDGEEARLYLFEKVPEEGRIKITCEKYNFTDNKSFETVMEKFVTDLANIFLDIYVNLAWVNHESSRLFKLSNYTDFIAAVDGHCVEIEKQCWHIFKPEYFGQDTSNPSERMPMDHEDNSVAVTPMAVQDIPEEIEGDEIVPVFSWDTLPTEAWSLTERAHQASHKIYMRPVSRAVRDPATGEPTHPSRNDLWNTTYNRFTEDDGTRDYAVQLEVQGTPQHEPGAMAEPLSPSQENVEGSAMPPAPGYRTPLSVMRRKVPTEYIQDNDELDDEDDFWHDPAGEAEALNRIGISTEPKWHRGSQPTTSTLGMSGVKYFTDPAGGDIGQPFRQRRRTQALAQVTSASQTSTVASARPTSQPTSAAMLPPPSPRKQVQTGRSESGGPLCQKHERETTGDTPKPRDKWRI